MSEDYVKREEYNESLNRIHARVDDIAKETTQIGIYAKVMKEASDKFHECIFGNGKDGMMTKITKLFERVSLQTKLITAIIFSILGLSFYILQSFLIK